MRIKIFYTMFCRICCLLSFHYTFTQGVKASGAVAPGVTVTITNAEKETSCATEGWLNCLLFSDKGVVR